MLHNLFNTIVAGSSTESDNEVDMKRKKLAAKKRVHRVSSKSSDSTAPKSSNAVSVPCGVQVYLYVLDIWHYFHFEWLVINNKMVIF